VVFAAHLRGRRPCLESAVDGFAHTETRAFAVRVALASPSVSQANRDMLCAWWSPASFAATVRVYAGPPPPAEFAARRGHADGWRPTVGRRQFPLRQARRAGATRRLGCDRPARVLRPRGTPSVAAVFGCGGPARVLPRRGTPSVAAIFRAFNTGVQGASRPGQPVRRRCLRCVVAAPSASSRGSRRSVRVYAVLHIARDVVYQMTTAIPGPRPGSPLRLPASVGAATRTRPTPTRTATTAPRDRRGPRSEWRPFWTATPRTTRARPSRPTRV